MRFFSRTPVRTFVIYPAVAIAWELAVHGARLRPAYYFAPLMVWGYLQYRLCGRYRGIRGGGGPGLDAPPERLVTTGFYAYTLGTAVWFHTRVVGDEKKLVQTLGQPYVDYLSSVHRWIPGLF